MKRAVMHQSQRPLMEKEASTFCSIAWYAYLFYINCIIAAEASFWEGQELKSNQALSCPKSGQAVFWRAPIGKGGKSFFWDYIFKKKATPSYCTSVACLQRRLFSQIHESGKEAMASTACPFCEGGQKDVFSILASVFAFSRASFGNSVFIKDWSVVFIN